MSFTPENYTSYLAEETWRTFACRATTMNELFSWQKAFRPRLDQTLGIPRIRERGECDLNPEQKECTECHDHIRELWTIESEPGFRIPFYLLRPYNQQSPLPLILAPHGHGTGHLNYVGLWKNEEEKANAEEGERDIGLQAVRSGYIAIVPVLRGYHQMALQTWGQNNPGFNTCETQQKLALLFGRTLIGERCHDMSRILDYTCTRPDIQSERVAITGNSGGGTISLFAAALDRRIKVAIPGSYFCTFEASLGSIQHCGCNYVPGILRLAEMYDIAGLIAPRPLLVVTGENDHIFPVAAVRYAFEKTKKIYEVGNAGDRCDLYAGSEGHRYYKKPVWPFVNKWL